MLLKRTTMALALASAGLCFTAAASSTNAGVSKPGPAQSTQDPTPASTSSDAKNAATKKKGKRQAATKLQAIQVHGFVSSIENSIALKRDSSSIVEAVSAEQIGKLPGTSIADTLGRLPGLAVQTVNGRPQVLSIHGLGPDFSTALINGNQQVSTSNNRDVQFDQYPSSWFDNVVVHLSPSADLIGQGLAGTVDMHTIQPLEKDKGEAAINAHYVWDGLGQLSKGPGVSDNGYQVNGIWVHQFADHTFGVTLGVDLNSNPAQIEHQAPWGYPTDTNGDLVAGGAKNYGISDQFKRQGFLATFQWRPSDAFTSTLNLTYDNFKDTQQLKGMEFPLGYGPDGTKFLTPGNVSNGFVNTGTYGDVKTVVRNDYNQTKSKVWNIDWSNEIRFNENWSAKVDANYSRADRRDYLLESYAGTGYGIGNGATDTIGFIEKPNGLLYLSPTLDYTSKQLLLTDPQGWGAGATPPVVQAGFLGQPRTNDYLANLRLAVRRDLASGPISSIELGVDRSTRDKNYNIGQNFIILPGGAKTAAIPDATATDPLAWMGVGPQVTYDPLRLLANGTYQLFSTVLSSIATPPFWNVRERDLTSYLQFNVDTSIGAVGLRGNFGLQAVHTNQTSEGQYAAASAGGTNGSDVTLYSITGGTNYTRYLPSANLVFSFDGNNDFRIGAARTMARPRMDQMSSSIGLNTSITHLTETNPNLSYFSASGGNAKLLPTMADNYNVSYEHYFNGKDSGYKCSATDSKASDLCNNGHPNAGYFSLSAYLLDLHNYINPSSAYLYDFKNFVPSYLTPAQQAQLGTTLGIVSGPRNDGRGYVKGAQATLSLPLNQLSPYLDGFGMILTGNYTKSSVVYGGNPNPITVPGLSKWVANGTLYYQKRGFAVRVSDSYRSDFLGSVSGLGATRIEQNIKGGSSYDAQISYMFDSGRLKGLTILASGSNLSNKTYQTFQNNDSRQVLTWENYGRRYDVGVSYMF